MKKQMKKLALTKETVRSLEYIKNVRGGSLSGASCDDPCGNNFQPITWVLYSCSC